MTRHTAGVGASGFPRTDIASTLVLDDAATTEPAKNTAPSTLSPSLLQDLRRFSEDPVSADLLAVVAASVRHGRALILELDLEGRVIDMLVNPRQQLYFSSVDVCTLGDRALAGLELVRVDAYSSADRPGRSRLQAGPLRPLLWHLALRGARSALLPEISGPIRCRLAFGVSLSGLPMDDATLGLLRRMTTAPVSIDDLLAGGALSRLAVQRIWNALYLQSALMVSRALAR
jgi:hypothetical protein